MPAVYPFRAVQYAAVSDLSTRVAPPYDVLDRGSKDALLDRDPRNIVAIDLPHLPAKELGPPAAYEAAGATYRDWLANGLLKRRQTPAMFAYRQTFQSDGRSVQRTGMACAIACVPFGPRAGGGILPHEQTFSGPKEDRLALMRATRAQLSPVFGLHHDAAGRARSLLAGIVGSKPADVTARTADGVLHEVWTIESTGAIAAYADALAGEDVFIADGHHRYNTALNYLAALEATGPVGPDHPARRSLVVLVGMSDPGLVIWPTHRVLGGMSGYSFERFQTAAAEQLRFFDVTGGLTELDLALRSRDDLGGPRLGLHDFATGRGVLAVPRSADPLARIFGNKPEAWRQLDVAFCQHILVDGICQPKLNNGAPVKWAFPHTIAEVEDIGRGQERGSGGGSAFAPQLAVLVRPTPLDSVRAVSAAGELMPQKSTFFYPKLATGLFINPLGE
ncbi:MAG: DUF1015 domain-containing protein [Phycisphaerae bacterium]|nr:DUF1015 domain-containing protein [Phycisphaerae bacterium]